LTENGRRFAVLRSNDGSILDPIGMVRNALNNKNSDSLIKLYAFQAQAVAEKNSITPN